MSIDHTKSKLSLTVTAVIALTLALAGAAQAAEAPVKEIVSSHWGFKVNASTEGNVCTGESKDTCRPGTDSTPSNGFSEPIGVAVNNDPGSSDYGDVYVVQQVSVRELTAAGAFVRVFGEDVNETKDGTAGATQAEKNVCTEEEIETSSVKCKNGGAEHEGIEPASIAVNPASGDVYLLEGSGRERVSEYTASGQLVLMIGGDVNKTKTEQAGSTEAERNLCTEKSGDACQETTPNTAGDTAHGAFNFYGIADGNQLAVGSGHILYVGDESRVQEFDTEGKYTGEIPLASIISSEPESRVYALAIDQATGDLYTAYGDGYPAAAEKLSMGIYEFDATGQQVAEFPLSPGNPNAERLTVGGMALDASGHLAVTGEENFYDYEDEKTETPEFGLLLDAATGHLISEFAVPGTLSAAFSATGEMYTLARNNHEVVSYRPLPVGQLATSAVPCTTGAERGTDVTVDCMLSGEVDPWGVAETETWFKWGQTRELGEETPKQPVADGTALVAVTPATIAGLKPNETYYYQLVGYDHNDRPPEEALPSRPVGLFTTKSVAPRIVGEASAPAVGFASAVLFAELNPENANTSYEFEYGPCEDLQACAGTIRTPVVESPAYGAIGTTVEVSGLQPAAVYHYRLVAKSTGGEAVGGEASFTTAPAPVVQAQTGAASAIGATSAVVSGTVDPDGQAAAYSFELGVYNGVGTQFGIVLSGAAGAGSTPVEESLAVSGLQPGTTYAYRIVAHSGDGSTAGTSAAGATATFTTAGLPAVLVSPSSPMMLAAPAIAFPVEATVSPPVVKTLTRAQKLAGALKVCKKEKSKGKRASCERQARKRYVVNTNAKGKKHAGGKKHG